MWLIREAGGYLLSREMVAKQGDGGISQGDGWLSREMVAKQGDSG